MFRTLMIAAALMFGLTTHAAAQKQNVQVALTQLHGLCERDYKPACIKLGVLHRKNSAKGSEQIARRPSRVVLVGALVAVRGYPYPAW